MNRIPKNKHKGERCFVVASGPSIKGMDLSPLKDETVICVNESWKALGWPPEYICIADRNLWPLVKDTYAEMHESKIVCSGDIDSSCGSGYLGNNLVLKARVNVNKTIREDGFSWDLAHPNGLPKSMNVITMIVLPFVFWAGFSEVYLVGCDCSNGGYFYPMEESACPGKQQFTGSVMSDYRAIASTPNLPTKIYNSTVGGYLEAFERVPFEIAVQKHATVDNTVVVGYYTPDADYKERAMNMQASVERFGLLCDIQERESYPMTPEQRKSCLPWVLNCSMCSDCILDAMAKYPDKYILYLDADALMVRAPNLFLDEPIDYDFAAPVLTNDYVQDELASNTMFFAPRPEVKALVQDWNTLQKTRNECALRDEYPPPYHLAWDQKTLQDVLAEHPEIRFKELPWEYGKLTPTKQGIELMQGVDPNNIVITQYQASRDNKWKVGHGDAS